MKKILIILCLLLFTSSSALAQDIDYNNVGPRGFRGIAWGADINSIYTYHYIDSFVTKAKKQFELLRRSENSLNADLYTVQNERFDIGSCKATGIIYLFKQDKFVGVLLGFATKTDVLNFLSLLSLDYPEDLSDIKLVENRTKIFRTTFANSYIITGQVQKDLEDGQKKDEYVVFIYEKQYYDTLFPPKK